MFVDSFFVRHRLTVKLLIKYTVKYIEYILNYTFRMQYILTIPSAPVKIRIFEPCQAFNFNILEIGENDIQLFLKKQIGLISYLLCMKKLCHQLHIYN